MVEETAIRVQINAAKLAGQGIFGILQAVANMLQARQYGQQSIQSLNRQSQALASVELNDKTLPYVRRQLKEYSVDYSCAVSETARSTACMSAVCGRSAVRSGTCTPFSSAQ